MLDWNKGHRRRVLARAPFFVVLLALGNCAPVAPTHRAIEEIADEYLAARLERYPELGTQYGIAGARHDRLTDNSPEALAAWNAREDAWLQELETIGPPGEVGSRDWVTFGILRETLASSKAVRVCRNELWQASAVTAWHTSVPYLFEIQPVDTPDQRRQARDRLRALVVYIDREIENLRAGLAVGLSTPRGSVVRVPGEVRALLGDDSPLLSPGVRAQDPEFAKSLRSLFEAEVRPAIERFADFIESEYLPAARVAIAITEHANGAECYQALLRDYATVGPTAGEVHKLGLERIGAIRAEMQAVLDESFPGEALEPFLRKLNTDPAYTFKSTDEVLQYSLGSLEAARAKMPLAFGRLPKADVLIKPYPAHRESGTGEYQSSSEDGTRPGVYYIAVVEPEKRSRAIQQSVLFHETYPGHHLQGALALELGDRVHPLARYLWFSGYGEGWALYAERLADELNLYGGPLDRMGLLSDQSARAARLVIDSGIHTMGWTRQESVDYLLRHTAWPAADIESEIDRYIAWPGQAPSYMLGMLEIRRLREGAEKALGDKFDLRAFHDRLLGNGNITLPMLEESMNAWLDGLRRAQDR